MHEAQQHAVRHGELSSGVRLELHRWMHACISFAAMLLFLAFTGAPGWVVCSHVDPSVEPP